MPRIFTTCDDCKSKVPTQLEFPEGARAKITNHTVLYPCPNCGGKLQVKDGIYTATSYKIEYSPLGSNTMTNNPVKQSNTFMYGDYVRKLSREFESELAKIEANHNFEYGEEFEKAISAILRRVLPDHFGVCRGYVVDNHGNKEGDDIIIYDRMRFPRLRPVNETDTDTKQRIPIEAVYAYIEAKHTLTLTGTSGQSFAKAIEQINNVKALCNTRPPVSWRALNRHVTLSKKATITREQGGPKTRNPLYTAIFSRSVRLSKGKSLIEPSGVIDELKKNKRKIPVPFQNSPDLVVFGSDVSMLPFFRRDSNNVDYVSPFYVEGAQCMPVLCQGTAFGVALCSILFALDNIELGRLKWSDVIGEVIGATNSPAVDSL